MKFSLIVPVYNINFSYLDNCIQTILNQTYSDFELIIIDDGSEQECAAKCDYYSRIDFRVKVIHQENKGLAGARNTGIRNSTGDWIIHVDADDWVKDDLLQSLADMVSDQSVDIVLFGYESYNKDRIRRHDLRDKTVFEKMYDEIKIDVLQAIMRANHTFDDLAINTTWGKAFRRSFITKTGIWFDEDLRRAQDVIYNLYVFSKAKSVRYLNGIYYVYRNDNESLSRGFNPKNIDRMTKTANACLDFINVENYNKELDDAGNDFVRGCFLSIVDTVYCNKINPDSYFNKKKEFLELLEKEPYKSAFSLKKIHNHKLAIYIEERLISYKLFFLLVLYKRLYSFLYMIKDGFIKLHKHGG